MQVEFECARSLVPILEVGLEARSRPRHSLRDPALLLSFVVCYETWGHWHIGTLGKNLLTAMPISNLQALPGVEKLLRSPSKMNRAGAMHGSPPRDGAN
jgi:hypothetical protein